MKTRLLLDSMCCRLIALRFSCVAGCCTLFNIISTISDPAYLFVQLVPDSLIPAFLQSIRTLDAAMTICYFTLWARLLGNPKLRCAQLQYSSICGCRSDTWSIRMLNVHGFDAALWNSIRAHCYWNNLRATVRWLSVNFKCSINQFVGADCRPADHHDYYWMVTLNHKV